MIGLWVGLHRRPTSPLPPPLSTTTTKRCNMKIEITPNTGSNETMDTRKNLGEDSELRVYLTAPEILEQINVVTKREKVMKLIAWSCWGACFGLSLRLVGLWLSAS